MNINAFVIKKIPIREHDQMIVLYSRELGKCAVIAKGSLRRHSRQALALDEGNLLQCELVQGRAGYIMTGAQPIRSYGSLKSSAVRLAAEYYFLQIIDVLVYDHQPDEQLWECLGATSAALDAASDADTTALVYERQQAFLKVMGYGAIPSQQSCHDQFNEIAQRRLTAFDLFSSLAARCIS